MQFRGYAEASDASGDAGRVHKRSTPRWNSPCTDPVPNGHRGPGTCLIVYSRTLQTPSSAKTRIEREFDPDAVRQLKLSSTADLSIGGGDLAGQAIGAGLVDELHLFLCPVLVGRGKRTLPDNVCAQLELLDERRFKNGFVHLHYRVRA